MWKSFFKQWKTSSFMTMVLPLFIAIPLVGMGFLSFREDRKFEQTGITVTAVVGETWIDSSEEGPNSYHLDYTYEVSPGENIYSEVRVSSSNWPTYIKGKEIQIVYLPNRTTKNRIIGEPEAMGIVWLFFGFFPLFFAFIFFVRHYRKSKKFLSLYNDGVKVKAEVISIETSSSTVNDVSQKYLIFKYEDAAGETHKGNTDSIYPAEMKYKVGDSIEIFYDPQDPSLYDMDQDWEWMNNS